MNIPLKQNGEAEDAPEDDAEACPLLRGDATNSGVVERRVAREEKILPFRSCGVEAADWVVQCCRMLPVPAHNQQKITHEKPCVDPWVKDELPQGIGCNPPDWKLSVVEMWKTAMHAAASCHPAARVIVAVAHRSTKKGKANLDPVKSSQV